MSDYLPLPANAKKFKDRFEQLTYALSQRPTGYCLEFGVYKGKTTRHIGKELGVYHAKLYAFDTFTGLPEKWDFGDRTHEAGHFDLNGKIPKLGENTVPIKGLIEETLPNWLATTFKHRGIGFVHIDVDLYSTTKTILSLIKSRLAPRAIIVFDELADFQAKQIYTNWREGEYKALIEEIPNFEIISSTETYAVAVRV